MSGAHMWALANHIPLLKQHIKHDVGCVNGTNTLMKQTNTLLFVTLPSRAAIMRRECSRPPTSASQRRTLSSARVL
jgi:hypothetical protein